MECVITFLFLFYHYIWKHYTSNEYLCQKKIKLIFFIFYFFLFFLRKPKYPVLSLHMNFYTPFGSQTLNQMVKESNNKQFGLGFDQQFRQLWVRFWSFGLGPDRFNCMKNSCKVNGVNSINNSQIINLHEFFNRNNGTNWQGIATEAEYNQSRYNLWW